jgi:hypothetical protein
MPLDTLFSTGLHALFYIVTLLFVFYSVCIAFHWFSYGSSKSMSMLSMAIYLIVSAPLFLAMALKT